MNKNTFAEFVNTTTDNIIDELLTINDTNIPKLAELVGQLHALKAAAELSDDNAVVANINAGVDPVLDFLMDVGNVGRFEDDEVIDDLQTDLEMMAELVDEVLFLRNALGEVA